MEDAVRGSVSRRWVTPPSRLGVTSSGLMPPALSVGLIRRPGPSWFYLCPLPRLCLQREQGAFQLITQATFRARRRRLPRPQGAGAELQPSSPIVPWIVWALEESSFMKIFLFSSFFCNLPPPALFFSFSAGTRGAEQKRLLKGVFSLLSLKRSELMAEETSFL